MKALPVKFSAEWRRAKCDELAHALAQAEADAAEEALTGPDPLAPEAEAETRRTLELARAELAQPHVEYQLEPVNNRQFIGVSTRYGGGVMDGSSDLAWELLALQLKGLRGVSVADGSDLALEFEQITFGREKCQRVSDDTLNRLPRELISELLIAALDATSPSDAEVANVGFTSGLPEPESSATETKTDAPTAAPTESCSSDSSGSATS